MVSWILACCTGYNSSPSGQDYSQYIGPDLHMLYLLLKIDNKLYFGFCELCDKKAPHSGIRQYTVLTTQTYSTFVIHMDMIFDFFNF